MAAAMALVGNGTSGVWGKWCYDGGGGGGRHGSSSLILWLGPYTYITTLLLLLPLSLSSDASMMVDIGG